MLPSLCRCRLSSAKAVRARAQHNAGRQTIVWIRATRHTVARTKWFQVEYQHSICCRCSRRRACVFASVRVHLRSACMCVCLAPRASSYAPENRRKFSGCQKQRSTAHRRMHYSVICEHSNRRGLHKASARALVLGVLNCADGFPAEARTHQTCSRHMHTIQTRVCMSNESAVLLRSGLQLLKGLFWPHRDTFTFACMIANVFYAKLSPSSLHGAIVIVSSSCAELCCSQFAAHGAFFHSQQRVQSENPVLAHYLASVSCIVWYRRERAFAGACHSKRVVDGHILDMRVARVSSRIASRNVSGQTCDVATIFSYHA